MNNFISVNVVDGVLAGYGEWNTMEEAEAALLEPDHQFAYARPEGSDVYWIVVGETVVVDTASKAADAFVKLRADRDELISKSDWRAMPDAPTMSDAWKAYREALRDLPGTLNDTTVLETITWPTEPS